MSDIGMNYDVDIGTLPISEWRFSVRHICLRYRNNRCRCRMSDIADIEIDVDAHLCLLHNPLCLIVYKYLLQKYCIYLRQTREAVCSKCPIWLNELCITLLFVSALYVILIICIHKLWVLLSMNRVCISDPDQIRPGHPDTGIWNCQA
jgi:hypothetical protein